jgi:hypothetical protein
MRSTFGSLDNARAVINELVERYRANRDRYESSSYNEEPARNEFINPLFEALGWDIANKASAAEQYKDVIHEESIKVGDFTKAPDYTFRFGQRISSPFQGDWYAYEPKVPRSHSYRATRRDGGIGDRGARRERAADDCIELPTPGGKGAGRTRTM